jgi:LPS-assembly protein
LAGTICAVIFAALFMATPAAAQSDPTDLFGELEGSPALISADEIFYDEELGVVTATGHVEIAQNGRTLMADSVSYNLRTNVVTAAGNVSLTEPDGTVFFAEYVELAEDLREGFIRDIGVLMADRTRIAAASGERRGGNITEFNKAVFSPCQLCRKDPSRAPLWQLKADRVVHDQKERVVRYNNARLEMFGVPVAYTPYFQHPDPTVDRQSGLLAPTIGQSDRLGFVLKVPYYWNIAPDKDATFEPMITTKQSVVLGGEYRQLFTNGEIELKGSATIADRETDSEVKDDQFRGHIDNKGRFDIDDIWRWGFDANRATDDTYLRLYNFSDEATLTSNVFAEALDGRNYMAVNAFAFQGQRDDDPTDELPIVLPLVDYNYLSEPDSLGGRYSVDTNLGLLSRIEGRDTGRVSLKGGWEMPFVGKMGDVYRIMANVQADGYWAHDYDPQSDDVNPAGPTESDVVGRFFPQLAVQWRYPWFRPSDWYGLAWSISSDYIGEASAFVGQSLRAEQDDAFNSGTGLDDSLSDIVGRVRLQPQDDIDLSYRFRYDKDNLTAERHELDFRIGPPAFQLDLNYIFLTDQIEGTTDFEDREELTVRARSQVNQTWSLFGGHRRDLQQNDALESFVGATYQDECFLISVEGKRTYFDDREIEPEDSIMVQLVFKYLGDFSVD